MPGRIRLSQRRIRPGVVYFGLVGIGGVFAGALSMAVFHGLGGAYRLNSALGLANPPRAAAAR